MKVFARLAIVAVLAAGLSGCTVIGSLGDKAQIDLGLASLSSDLKEIPGVTDVSSTAKLTPDYRYVIEVHATAEEVSDSDLLRIATLVNDKLGSGVFTTETVQFDLSLPEGALLSMTLFALDKDVLAQELDYRSRLSGAYGEALGIRLSSIDQATESTSAGGNYSRQIFTLLVAKEPDWDAMRSVPDPSTAQREWQFPEVSGSGSFPTTVQVELGYQLKELQGELDDLLPDDPESYIWVTAFGEDSADVSVQLPAFDFADSATAEWPFVRAVADRVAAANLSNPNIGVYDGTSSGSGAAHFGDCEADSAMENDTALATGLGSGWKPGWCNLSR